MPGRLRSRHQLRQGGVTVRRATSLGVRLDAWLTVGEGPAEANFCGGLLFDWGLAVWPVMSCEVDVDGELYLI